MSTQSAINNWSAPPNVGFPVSTIYSVLWSNGEIFAGTSNNGIFVTTDGGNFWSQTGISSPLMFCSVKVLAQAKTVAVANGSNFVLGGAIYAGTDTAGSFYTVDSGQNWTHIPSITASDVSCFMLLPGIHTSGSSVVTKPMFAGTMDGGVSVSTDGETNWKAMNDGLTDSSVASLAMDPQGFLYAATDSGVYKTTDVVTAIDSRTHAGLGTFSLNQNYPNPFNPTTAISG